MTEQHPQWLARVRELDKLENEQLNKADVAPAEDVERELRELAKHSGDEKWRLIRQIASTPAKSIEGIRAQVDLAALLMFEWGGESNWTDEVDVKAVHNASVGLAALSQDASPASSSTDIDLAIDIDPILNELQYGLCNLWLVSNTIENKQLERAVYAAARYLEERHDKIREMLRSATGESATEGA